MARVQIHQEVREHERSSEWTLCFQFCTYHLDDGPRDGYRFIWRTPEGHLQPARGQARIEDRATLEKLLGMAETGGWF